jgi:hypothetical protein
MVALAVAVQVVKETQATLLVSKAFMVLEILVKVAVALANNPMVALVVVV